MDYKINNSEFALLSLIEELGNCNGYQLRQIVEERGYGAWSGVSSSSIYVTLKKLEKRRFVLSQPDTQKQSKGPTGRIYNVTDGGKQALELATIEALTYARETDPRYNLALCGIDLLPVSKVLECFEERQKSLQSILDMLEDMAQMAMPLSAKLLYGRIIEGLKAEINWMKDAVEKISSQ
ncbi:PadR family transcriptional regulator [Photobacterium makurazakiensis]|uniref:PadR family transcriptional regulator n=1 Tax=Photobacterium makurazakiensis TaxID=2910234 RepID=UPI003D14E8F1